MDARRFQGKTVETLILSPDDAIKKTDGDREGQFTEEEKKDLFQRLRENYPDVRREEIENSIQRFDQWKVRGVVLYCSSKSNSLWDVTAVAGFLIVGVDTWLSNRRFVRRAGHGLLAGIATSTDFRRRGVASSMMAAFIRRLRAANVRHMIYGGCGPEGNASRNVARSVGANIEVRHFTMRRRV
jgi:ribosomal protein S18 acetylase RimI-like enzyme